jgi:hypothetical protein
MTLTPVLRQFMKVLTMSQPLPTPKPMLFPFVVLRIDFFTQAILKAAPKSGLFLSPVRTLAGG